MYPNVFFYTMGYCHVMYDSLSSLTSAVKSLVIGNIHSVLDQ